MPIYEYQCSDCGARSEEIQKFSDLPLEVCEICSGRLERLMGSPALHFKGECWANDGYASEKGSKKSVVQESRKALVDSSD